MWIYQSVHGIAQHNKLLPSFQRDELSLIQSVFDITGHKYTTNDNRQYINKGTFDNNEAIPNFDQENTKIGNYLQNLEYFKPLNVRLRDFYTIQSEQLENARQILPPKSLCLHRRYFPTNHHANKCPTDRRIQNAIKNINKKGQTVVVFSNDVNRAKKSFHAKSISFIDPGTALSNFREVGERRPTDKTKMARDFAALTLCDTLIVTCGSFSGFAAALHSGSGSVYHFDDTELMRTFGPDIISQWTLIDTQVSVAPMTNTAASKWETFLPSTTTANDYCSTGHNGKKWLEKVYSSVPLTSKCVDSKRIGGKGDGGKKVCLDNIVNNDCVVYSLGSRLDFSFENDVLKQLGCEVHTFDCTVGVAKNVPTGVNFHPWCVGGLNELKPISSDLGHQGETGQYYTLKTIMTKLNHNHIDLLKMDIERHEYAVIESLDVFPAQIVFETHLHNAYGMFGRPVSESEWSAMWKKLKMSGYGVFSNEPNPMCLCCCEWSVLRSGAPIINTTPQKQIE